jgi:hypothetical protein
MEEICRSGPEALPVSSESDLPPTDASGYAPVSRPDIRVRSPRRSGLDPCQDFYPGATGGTRDEEVTLDDQVSTSRNLWHGPASGPDPAQVTLISRTGGPRRFDGLVRGFAVGRRWWLDHQLRSVDDDHGEPPGDRCTRRVPGGADRVRTGVPDCERLPDGSTEDDGQSAASAGRAQPSRRTARRDAREGRRYVASPRSFDHRQPGRRRGLPLQHPGIGLCIQRQAGPAVDASTARRGASRPHGGLARRLEGLPADWA